jgi:hypothetical protein
MGIGKMSSLYLAGTVEFSSDEIGYSPSEAF